MLRPAIAPPETRAGSNSFTATFTHDRNGNMLTRASGGQTDRGVYNAFNQLTQFSGGNTISTYFYHANGLRHRKTVNGATTHHVWVRGHIISEHDGIGGAVRVYVRRAGGRLIRNNVHEFSHNLGLMDIPSHATADKIMRWAADGRNAVYTASEANISDILESANRRRHQSNSAQATGVSFSCGNPNCYNNLHIFQHIGLEPFFCALHILQ